jgi:CRISPR system Cascade subunit CasA
MNPLTDDFFVFRTSNAGLRCGPATALADPEVRDIAFPRADFDGAAWQLLIGLLQTAYAPEDYEAWEALWKEPPSQADLTRAFEPCRYAFECFGDGPRFMQDYDALEETKPSSVASLLIETPGEQGIKFNTDHFNKRGLAEVMCPRCAVMALFTMQINAPSGGQGHRTGLRGGGPLTTLVLPPDDAEPLWRKLWLNVLPQDWFAPQTRDQQAGFDDWRLFPWLGPTRTSDRAGSETTPADVHPLHVYWAMPRRFRLLREEQPDECAICGEASDARVTQLRNRNRGYNYTGPWRHPLTPYTGNTAVSGQELNPMKGQYGGLGYRHWESLVLDKTDKRRGHLPAQVVQDYPDKARELTGGAPGQHRARLWVFGYDMDNMKPRGWYVSYMPLFGVPREAGQQERLLAWLDVMTAAANNAASQVRNGVKAAWYNRPGDAGGDFSFIDRRFWEATEPAFYDSLKDLVDATATATDGMMPPEVAKAWYRTVGAQASAVFDALVFGGDTEAAAMRRAMTARRSMQKKVMGTKEMKQLRAWAGLDQATNTPSTASGAAATEVP